VITLLLAGKTPLPTLFFGLSIIRPISLNFSWRCIKISKRLPRRGHHSIKWTG